MQIIAKLAAAILLHIESVGFHTFKYILVIG